MKRYYLPLLVGAIVPRPAVAQDEPTPVVLEKVRYSPKIPKGLWSFLPRGGTSRFWGESNITYHSKKVWIHVYDVRKTRFAKEATAEEGEQDSGIDLFVFSTAQQLKRISTTRFTYRRFGGYKRGGAFETVGVGTLWLNPNSHKVPIVDVSLQNPNGLYRSIIRDAICVFNAGVEKKASVDLRFGTGAGNGSDWVSWNTKFAVQSDGRMSIVYTQARIENRRTFYRWEDDQFKPFRRVVLGYDDPTKSTEIPFDTP